MAAVEYGPAIGDSGHRLGRFGPGDVRGLLRRCFVALHREVHATGLFGRTAPAAAHFDADYYLARYPDVARVGGDPLRHYRAFGWRECRDPNAWMSTSAYLQRHPELLTTGEDPLSHMARKARQDRTARRAPLQIPRPRRDRTLLLNLVESQPQFLTKWWACEYLARGLSDMERARSHLHTFAVLGASFPDAALQRLLFEGLTLWGAETALGRIAVRFALATAPNEGELALSVTLRGDALAVLSFNLFPGDPLDRGDVDRIFVGRMQTAPQHRGTAKQISAELGDVTLQACLFAAVRGVAQALGASEFYGVPASRQVSLQPDGGKRGVAAYDGFFESVGARLTESGLYRGPVAMEERPMSEVKAGHKIRTRRRRELKQAICASAKTALEEHRSGADLRSSTLAAYAPMAIAA